MFIFLFFIFSYFLILFISVFQANPKKCQLIAKDITSDVNSVSMISKTRKYSEKDDLNFNKKYLESNIIPDHGVNSFTPVEIKTEDQIKNEISEDELELNSFSVIEMKTEDDSEDVSTKVMLSKLKHEKINM